MPTARGGKYELGFTLLEAVQVICKRLNVAKTWSNRLLLLIPSLCSLRPTCGYANCLCLHLE